MEERLGSPLMEETENVNTVSKEYNIKDDFEAKLRAHYFDSFENSCVSERRSSVATDEMTFEADHTKRRAKTIQRIKSLFGYSTIE